MLLIKYLKFGLFFFFLELVKEPDATVQSFKHIVWTFHMRRMAVLVGQALKFEEPILLVGETG